MDNKNNHIDDLFSDKFDNLELKTSSEEWSNLSSSLGKANFLKFSLTSVNVYVVGVAVAFASTAGYIGITNTKQNDGIKQLDDKIELLEEPEKVDPEKQLIADSTTFVVPYEENSKNLILPKKHSEQTKEKSTPQIKTTNTPGKKGITDENKLLSDSAIKSETSLIRANPEADSITTPILDSVTKTKPRKVRRVKKKVYLKQDKVIIKDTVVIKK